MRIPEDIAIASVDGTVDWRILVVVATQVLQLSLWVGLAGFEPAASSSRTKRATKLRYSPFWQQS